MAKWVVILRFILSISLRVSVVAVGFAVLAVGVVLLVTPGPGLLVIIGGLAILAHEFTWAERALDKAKARAAALRRRPSPGTNSFPSD